MRDTLPFSTLLIEAFRLASKRQYHWRLAVFFGLIACLSYLTTSLIQFTSPLPESDVLSTWIEWFGQNTHFLLSFVGVSFFFALAQALLRGPVILTLEDTLLSENPKIPKIALTQTRYFRAAQTSLFFEILYDGVSSFFLAISFLPVFMALRYNENSFSTIFEIALFLSVAFAILFYFIREYGLYYSILGKLRLRTALELGYALFLKNFTLSLLFGALLIGLSFAFTFLFDSAMLGNVALLKSSSIFPIVVVFFLSSFFGLYREALRLVFFHSIAASPKKDEVVPEIVANPTPETPPVA